MSKHVAVLLGGWSSEREVSLTSGRECAKALREVGYRVTEIDVKRDLTALAEALTPTPDVVFNALHGRYGEDGTIQGVLEILGVPYTHSGILASSLAMNKARAKEIFLAAGIPCPLSKVVAIETLREGLVMDPPYVIKPVNEGSSVGVYFVREGDNGAALADWPFGDRAMAEAYVPGREITVAVMEGEALGVTELRPLQGFYDYEAKYTAGKTEHLCPAPVPDIIADEAKRYAVLAHEALGCRGVTRADFRYDDTEHDPGNLFMLELNTQPGMTPLSLVPEQAAYAGYSYGELVTWMVEHAACDA